MSWWKDEYSYRDQWFQDDPTLGDRPPTPDTIFVSGTVDAISRRGPIGVEWWSRVWVENLQKLAHDVRLERGRRTARKGVVHDLKISYGRVFARVSGSYYAPYRTAIEFRTFTDEEWNRVLAALSEQAIYGAKLLAGEMPVNIETVFENFGLSLFPSTPRDVQFACSCMDYEEPCKHASAIYYLLAEQLDADPLTLFHLRGRSREQVLAMLRAHRGVAASNNGGGDEETPEPDIASLEADLAAFWQPGPSPTQDIPENQPDDGLPDDSEGLHKLYAFISEAARQRFGEMVKPPENNEEADAVDKSI